MKPITMQQVADYVKAGLAPLGPDFAALRLDVDEDEGIVYVADDAWSVQRVQMPRETLGGAIQVEGWQLLDSDGNELGAAYQNLWQATVELVSLIAREMVMAHLDGVSMPGADEEEAEVNEAELAELQELAADQEAERDPYGAGADLAFEAARERRVWGRR